MDRRKKSTQQEKTRMAVDIKAFKNVDFTDCPPLTEEQMKEFKPSHLQNMANYKPIKKTINVRLDADVIQWLQSVGKAIRLV
jgi:uncharacterized protein (DUF4415 family)